MRLTTHIICMLLFNMLLTSCITVQIPVGDAIDSTKDWINEERDRQKQKEGTQQQLP